MRTTRSVENIYQLIVRFADEDRDCVLAVVLQAEGSTPCKAGAKAIIDSEGSIHGTIGGGAVEAETQRLAMEVIKTKRAVVLQFDLDSLAVDSERPICGGAVRVLLDPNTKRHRDVYANASTIQQQRQRGVLLTTIRGQGEWNIEVECVAEQSVPPGLAFPSSDAVRSVLKREATRLFVSKTESEGQRLEVLVEPVVPQPVLLILGGGHVGQAVATQANMVGFEIVVIDDRPEFTRPELFPDGTTLRCADIAEGMADFPFGADTYVIIVTHGHKHDADALAACLHEPSAYVGMIGSQRKVAMMRKDFVESGRATAEEFDRVYAPIGLDIGSVTVPEIATSIVAQLVAVRRKGTSLRILTK